jgi:ligand-binding sensor domain-containing protein
MKLEEKNIHSILNDSKGDLWVGFGAGFVEHHIHNGGIKKVFHLASLNGETTSGSVFKILEDSKGNIYCTSWRGGIQKYNPGLERFEPLFGDQSTYFKYIDGIDIRDVAEDADGRFWLAVHGKGIYAVDVNKKEVKKYFPSDLGPGITSPWVFSIAIDIEGFVWVTSAWGLSKINPVNDSVSRYINFENSRVLSDNAHNLLAIDKNDNLWVGTDRGLNLYHKESDKFFIYTIEDGLPSNIVRGLTQDESGLYWLSTPYGIVSFELMQSRADKPVLESVNTYNTYDGLIQDNFFINSYSEDNDGSIYFGGVSGIDYFSPSDIHPFFTEA